MSFASDAQRKWFFANNAGSSGAEGGSSGGGDGGSTAEQRYEAYASAPERREERASYAQAMFPDLSEAAALRRLNDRNG